MLFLCSVRRAKPTEALLQELRSRKLTSTTRPQEFPGGFLPAGRPGLRRTLQCRELLLPRMPDKMRQYVPVSPKVGIPRLFQVARRLWPRRKEKRAPPKNVLLTKSAIYEPDVPQAGAATQGGALRSPTAAAPSSHRRWKTASTWIGRLVSGSVAAGENGRIAFAMLGLGGFGRSGLRSPFFAVLAAAGRTGPCRHGSGEFHSGRWLRGR